MPSKVGSYNGRLPKISTSRRSNSALNYSTSSRNSSRTSCHSLSITPIPRSSKSANTSTPRSSDISSDCRSFSDRSFSDLSSEELTEYQLKKKRMKEGKFGKLFQNYFQEKEDAPPEISDPSDDEPYETDLDSDLGADLIRKERGRDRHEHEFKYGNACDQLKVIPNNFFVRHANTEVLRMKYRYLNYGDATAMASLIKSQDIVSKLDLSDNGIGAAAMLSLAELLLQNKTITEINFANNRIGTYGARLMKIIMQNNNKLTKVDISGNCIGEKGGVYCSHIIQNNIYLKELNLANNKIGDKGGVAIGKALGKNVTLNSLDISWNHIQLSGALAIAKGIKHNEQLKILKAGMNGFSNAGTQALVDSLANNNIIELDISSNRIGADGAKKIADGLRKTKLQILKLSSNPLTPDGAHKILTAANDCSSCSLNLIDLNNVIIDDEFITAAENIKKEKNIEIRYTFGQSKRQSSRELSKCEIDDLCCVLRDNNIAVREVFEDIMSPNTMVRVEDLVYVIEMSERCSDESLKILKQKTVHLRNHKFILKNLLSAEDENNMAEPLNRSLESIKSEETRDDLPVDVSFYRSKSKRKLNQSKS